MNPDTGSGRDDARESLLNELESIRSLLKEHNEEGTPHAPDYRNGSDVEIPILNDAITEVHNTVPVLNDRISLPEKPFIPAADKTSRTNSDLQLASVRAAAAVVAAKAVRNRDTGSRPTPLDTEQRKYNEQIITAIMDELRPQMESLLRNTLRKHLTAQGNNSSGNP